MSRDLLESSFWMYPTSLTDSSDCWYDNNGNSWEIVFRARRWGKLSGGEGWCVYFVVVLPFLFGNHSSRWRFGLAGEIIHVSSICKQIHSTSAHITTDIHVSTATNVHFEVVFVLCIQYNETSLIDECFIKYLVIYEDWRERLTQMIIF